MVFPRNAGFGRCYLVSTRHEILFNDENTKPNGNSTAAQKKLNKINPAVRLSCPMFVPTHAYGELEKMNWRLRHCKLLKSRKIYRKNRSCNLKKYLVTSLVGQKWIRRHSSRVQRHKFVSNYTAVDDSAFQLRKAREKHHRDEVVCICMHGDCTYFYIFGDPSNSVCFFVD